MKYMTKILTALTLIAILIYGSSCSDKATGKLLLHLHTNIDTSEVGTLGKFYPDSLGRPTALTAAQFYISNIGIQKSDGNWYNITGVYLLKKYESELYTVADVPADDYKDIRFDIGVDSAANAIAPSGHTTAADSVLGTNNTWMWYGSTAQGYIFMRLKGSVMVSSSSTVNFDYSIGGNVNRRTVTLPAKAFSVIPNQNNTVHLICDYGKLVQGLNMNLSSNWTTDSHGVNPNLATSLANNFATMFRYEM